MIPSIVIRPGISELQELMIQAGKIMVGVAKGVGQWSGNKKTKVIKVVSKIIKHEHHNEDMIFIWGIHIGIVLCCPRVCLRVRVSFVFLPAGVSRKTLESVKERLQRA